MSFLAQTISADLIAPQVVDRRDNAPLSQTVQQLKEDIQEDPGNIIDYLRISPKRKKWRYHRFIV